MEYFKLGNSDYKVSRMTLGCWTFGGSKDSYWGAQDKKESEALLKEAIDRGINLFDTAIAYNDGGAEAALGDAMSCGLREKMIICDKIPQHSFEKLDYFEQEVSECLKRLKTDYLDLLLLHWPCNDKNLLEANLEKLVKVREKGLVKEIGVSNFGVGQMDICKNIGFDVMVNELSYNIIHRAAELAIFPYTQKNNIGTMTYMPLLQGMLSGKYSSVEEIPTIRRRTIHFDSMNNIQIRHGGRGMEEELTIFLKKLKSISGESGISCSTLCIAWILKNTAVTSVISGCRTTDQLKANIEAFETDLPEDIYSELTAISEPLFFNYGANADLWQWNSRVW